MSSSRGDNVPCARLCHIVKWEDFDGYGFNLHAEKGKTGQFIGKVDDGSPSQAAGLRQGDRIIEVNEINIANETHKQVVERIKAFPQETKLLVVDPEADEYFKANNIVVKGTMANVKVIKTPEKNIFSGDDYIRSPDTGDFVVDESAQKSINSNDTSHSGSTAATTKVPATTSETENDEDSRSNCENGNGLNKSTSSDHHQGNGSLGNSVSGSSPPSLNLKMSAKELRAQLAARKKYDPKKESIGFKDKFDIVQKL